MKRFIAATNANDTVPRFLRDGKWLQNRTVATLSNAMVGALADPLPRVSDARGVAALLGASTGAAALATALPVLLRSFKYPFIVAGGRGVERCRFGHRATRPAAVV